MVLLGVENEGSRDEIFVSSVYLFFESRRFKGVGLVSV